MIRLIDGKWERGEKRRARRKREERVRDTAVRDRKRIGDKKRKVG